MKKSVILFVALLLALPCQALAHHPAADIVDAEIYAMIDAMVADTPHAELTFDDDMGDVEMIIETDTVSTAEALIDEGLLADLSLLDGEVTVTIEFPDDVETDASAALQFTGSREAAKDNRKYLKWSEWGGPVRITIHQVTTVP
jgi:hypothetical protein